MDRLRRMEQCVWDVQQQVRIPQSTLQMSLELGKGMPRVQARSVSLPLLSSDIRQPVIIPDEDSTVDLPFPASPTSVRATAAVHQTVTLSHKQFLFSHLISLRHPFMVHQGLSKENIIHTCYPGRRVSMDYHSLYSSSLPATRESEGVTQTQNYQTGSFRTAGSICVILRGALKSQPHCLHCQGAKSCPNNPAPWTCYSRSMPT